MSKSFPGLSKLKRKAHQEGSECQKAAKRRKFQDHRQPTAAEADEHLRDQLRSQHEPQIHRLLEEMDSCLEQGRQSPKETWFGWILEKVQQNFAAALWAEIGTLEGSSLGSGSTSLEDADVWYVTPEDMDRLVTDGAHLRKPIVICDNHPNNQHDKIRIARFLTRLELRFKSLNVQDLSLPVYKKHSEPVEPAWFNDRVRNTPNRLSQNQPPLNLLDLRGDILNEPVPAFIRDHDRFNLIPCLHHRAEARKKDRAGEERRIPAKKVNESDERSTKRKVCPSTAGKSFRNRDKDDIILLDLVACISFCIFAQRGAWSGWHIDILNGTWVKCLAGLKLWLIHSGPLTKQEQDAFARYGDGWVPEAGRARIILLRPGDTIFMPPGQIIPHAPLTITDCLMAGGMVWDEERVLDTLKNILWTAENPEVTNEPMPKQLPRIWDTLESLMEEHPERYQNQGFQNAFKKLTTNMKELLSCHCTGQCRDNCKCLSSRDRRCSTWCHQMGKKRVCMHP